jgi:hypothetical protein
LNFIPLLTIYTINVSISGTSRKKGMWDMVNFPDVSTLCLMCILMYL